MPQFTEEPDRVMFTPKMLKSLKLAWRVANEAKQEEFTFDGRHYYTAYAKYLIEYLEDKFRNQE